MTVPGARRVRAAGRHLGATVNVVRAALRNSALRRVLVAYLLFCAIEYGTWIAVLVYAYATTGPASVGVVGLVQLVPAALFAAVSSSAADRFPRHRVLLAGYVLQGACLGLAAVGMVLGASPVPVILASAGAVCVMTLTRPAQGALLPALSRTPEELTAANALVGTTGGAGVLVGPLATAGLLAIATPGAAFAVGAAAALVAALLVVRLPVRHVVGADGADRPASPLAAGSDGVTDASGPPTEGAIDRLLGGVRALVAGGDARLVVGILGLRMLVSGALDVLFVLLAIEVLGMGESGAGLLNAALGLGTLVGGAVSFVLVGRRSMTAALAASVAVFGLAFVLIGTVAPTWTAPLLMVAGGAGYATMEVVGRTVLQRVTDESSLARLLGALEGIGLAFLAVGSVLTPLVVGVIGIPLTVVVVGMVMPVTVVLAWRGLRRIDRTADVPVRELALLRTNAVLSPLPVPELETVARRTRWITFEAGQALIREGDAGDRYYVIESGAVRVSQGGRQLREMAAAGDGIGEIALLRDVPRTATVTALRPVVALAIGRAEFLGAVTGHEPAHAAGTRVADEREPGAQETRDAEAGPGPGRTPQG